MAEDYLWTNGVVTGSKGEIVLSTVVGEPDYFLAQTQYGVDHVIAFNRVELTTLVEAIVDFMDEAEMAAVVDQIIERKATLE